MGFEESRHSIVELPTNSLCLKEFFGRNPKSTLDVSDNVFGDTVAVRFQKLPHHCAEKHGTKSLEPVHGARKIRYVPADVDAGARESPDRKRSDIGNLPRHRHYSEIGAESHPRRRRCAVERGNERSGGIERQRIGWVVPGRPHPASTQHRRRYGPLDLRPTACRTPASVCHGVPHPDQGASRRRH